MGLTESKGEDIVPLGELVKQDLLGHGAMCQVFQAHWTPKNIPVALKQMMVPEVVPEDLADFRRELQLTRTMKHPNLVCLYGGCAEPPNLYLVMELVAHGAASDLLRTKTTDLSWPLRFRMALDTALGMRFLHSQKVMHRDLKTENLLVNSLQVDAETVVKISDLGISRFSEGNDALMTIGRGTTKWMAPEVLEGSNTYSFPVDVYSFGIILWEFYAQSAPYTEMIIDGYRPPVPHSCPPAYSRLMQDCWHGDPSKRPSFDEVTRRLFEMKDQVCPNLVLPPAVVAIYEKGEKGGEKPLLTSPKRAKPADAAAIAGEADSGKKQEKEKAKKEKKEKRKTKLKTKEKEDKKDKTATTTTAAATSSPAATTVTSPQSAPGSLQQRTAAGDNGSASVGSMVRRWEGGGGGGSSPALSTPGAAASRTAQQPARPPPRPVHSASMAHGVAHSRGAAATPSHSASPTSPPLARTGRAATVSGLPTSTAQAPASGSAAVGGSAIDDNKKKTGSFLPLGMFGGKKKMESTRN
ncbi:protein kinase domain containing protein [Acanthamoeba castellanii str. Neff]|uniref:Protein kinase domain containing protein n=1 Tax=Acanthamoeba castellanii (strain ATCC 30010 / Neff) TaxID=1257118 RepID=L8GU00_ACACF|nr:protein kinase domain containing protein [Acanthamoeba castellanii str. Neff]ELR16427.1 protein kinase domain containing protein [Acanthamoeba castellanii str. Neff]